LSNGTENNYIPCSNASPLAFPAQSMKHVTRGGYVTLLRDTRQILIVGSLFHFPTLLFAILLYYL